MCFQSCSIQIYSDAVGFLTILIDKNWCPAAQRDIAIYIDNTVICILLIGRTLNKDCAQIGINFFNSSGAIYCQLTMIYPYSLLSIGQRIATEIQSNLFAAIKNQTLGRIFQQFNCIGISSACIRNSVSQRIVIGITDLRYSNVLRRLNGISIVIVLLSVVILFTILRNIRGESAAGNSYRCIMPSTLINSNCIAFGNNLAVFDGNGYIAIFCISMNSGIIQIACTITPRASTSDALRGNHAIIYYKRAAINGNAARLTINNTTVNGSCYRH